MPGWIQRVVESEKILPELPFLQAEPPTQLLLIALTPNSEFILNFSV